MSLSRVSVVSVDGVEAVTWQSDMDTAWHSSGSRMASLYADAAAVSDERFPMDVLQHISVLVINIAPEGVVGYGLVGD